MGNEGNGNGSDGTKGAAGEVQQQLTDTLTKLGALESETKSLKDAKVDLERKLDDADKELLSEDYLNFKDSKSKGKGGEADDSKGAGEIDFDTASNREIVEYIGKKYKGDIGAVVKDISGRLDKTEKGLAMTFAQVDVALTALKHDGRDGKPAFDANQEAIFKIAKANPSWNAGRCYSQFLLQSKADADTEAERVKKEQELKDREATEKSGVPGSVVQDKQLSKDEAAALAYKKAFGNAA